ncbi:MAG TPA: hypothetical protein VF815_21930 [Myxococcaceae bacterium]|jgi:hypothetical protein
MGSDAFTIPGGQVKQLSVSLSSYGFSASVSFWGRLEKEDDPLYRAFLRPDLLRVRLAISGVYDQPDEASPPLVLQGLARTRSLGGMPQGGTEDEALGFRRYSIEFADAAQVLWRQHRPTELHTDKKMSELLEAHRVDPIQLSCEWDVLEVPQPMLCLGLGQDAPATSFYDFVMAYVHAHGGVWTYDSQEDRYLLTGSKPKVGKPVPLGGNEVRKVELALPPVPRHSMRVLNTFAAAPSTTELEQAQAVSGVRQDVLLRTPLAIQAEQRETREKQRLQLPHPRLRLGFGRLPTVLVRPGGTLRLEGSLWPRGLKGTDKPQRVREMSLQAFAVEPGPERDSALPSAGYQLLLTAVIEPEADPVPLFPPFRQPRYPIYAEGKMHSPGGEEGDRIYLLVDDEKNSLLFWRVAVPLWNKIVSVPAQPGFFPGHFYFPPYKNARVLLALHFDHAELHRSLDWGETVRLPMEAQGDQSLLGKNRTSQTAITHDYQEEKPVWTLHRVSANDLQTVRFAEGNMVLETREDPSTPKATPTFDVTPQVETAKSELASSVGGAIGETSATYQASTAAVTSDIQNASAEATAALEAANAEVSAKVTEARSEIGGAMGRLSESGAALSGAAAEARATLQGLL